MPNSETLSDYESQLAKFGLNSFRPGQKEVVQSVFDGQDCLCIMPTGGGKSLCYQFPSVVREGTTLVVSPLIALMKDQVDSMQELGISSACINSTQSPDEQSKIIRQLSFGELDLLYVAPERLRSPRFVEAIQNTPVQLLAIDEAHCISQWGHDFRPDYARLGKLRERIGNPQTIALTATATRDVQEDIARQLSLENPTTFVTGFARDNLSLQVSRPASIREKTEELHSFLNSHPGSGIIYASTRKKCEEISGLLSGQKRKFGFYHGGMTPEDRDDVQNRFMSGKLDVIIATNAFGMGIDKSDIRFVVHFNFPATLEAYYQEAGRAGRDGEPSDCLMLYSNGDRFIQEFFIENAYPSRRTVEQVYDYLRSRDEDPIEVTLADVKEALGLDIAPDGVGVCEQLLEKAGAIERLDTTQNLASVRLTGSHESFVELLPREAKTRRRVLQRIEKIVGEVRDERVYFQPRQLADDKLTLDSINRSIRQLNELDFFSYVPPFRGRAIHVVDRSRKFSTWRIDFDEMNRRKDLEYQKLQTMVDFANSRRCRQLAILEYFGDRDQKTCHTCDNCSRTKKAHGGDFGIPTKYLPGVYHCIRIVLSGVARSRGRFGRSVVCQMLWGSSSAKVKKTGLHKLTTFGLLSFLTQSEIEVIMDALIASSLVKQSEKTRFRPTIEIGETGKTIMKGLTPLPDNLVLLESLARKIAFEFPDAEATIVESKSQPDENRVEDASDTAGEADSNDNLDSESEKENSDEIAASKPTELDSEPESQQPAESQEVQVENRPEPKVDDLENVSKPATEEWQWTVDLLNRGFKPAEILLIRRMSIEEFFQHLEYAVESTNLDELSLVFSEKECLQMNSTATHELEIEWLPPEFNENAVNLYKKLKSLL